MSNFNWCHGPECHKGQTQDRIRGVKGHKVLRTRKVKPYSQPYTNFYDYFCSNSCYNDFAHAHIREIVAIAPRTAPLETPIEVTKEVRQGWNGNYTHTEIKVVDNV